MGVAHRGPVAGEGGVSLLGSLEALLEPPGVLWAVSWHLFGRSWGVLEALEAVLGRVDGQQCRASNFPPVLNRFWDPSWVPKGHQDGAQDEALRPRDDPRGCQNGTQEEQKSITKQSSKTIAS